jgi:hypothetical protein
MFGLSWTGEARESYRMTVTSEVTRARDGHGAAVPWCALSCRAKRRRELGVMRCGSIIIDEAADFAGAYDQRV